MLVSMRCPLSTSRAWSPTPTGCLCGLQCLSTLWYGCAVGYDMLVVPYVDGAGEETCFNTCVWA